MAGGGGQAGGLSLEMESSSHQTLFCCCLHPPWALARADLVLLPEQEQMLSSQDSHLREQGPPPAPKFKGLILDSLGSLARASLVAQG